MSSSAVQDRFTALVPALSKYGSVTVGLTLMLIGATGLYETLTEEAGPQVELAGASSDCSICAHMLMHSQASRKDYYVLQAVTAHAGSAMQAGIFDGT